MSLENEEIEQRLSSVEAGLAEIQQRLGIGPTAGNWVDGVSGSLADIPEDVYQEFLECCRAVRDGEPIPEAGESPP
jgi:hypothetical protein